jgi:hypothetical protein
MGDCCWRRIAACSFLPCYLNGCSKTSQELRTAIIRGRYGGGVGRFRGHQKPVVGVAEDRAAGWSAGVGLARKSVAAPSLTYWPGVLEQAHLLSN